MTNGDPVVSNRFSLVFDPGFSHISFRSILTFMQEAGRTRNRLGEILLNDQDNFI